MGKFGNFSDTIEIKPKPFLRPSAYFDGMNFAARAKAPALFSVGLMDLICPPSTVYAAYNHYMGEKEIAVYDYNDHEGGGSDQALTTFRILARDFSLSIGYNGAKRSPKQGVQGVNIFGIGGAELVLIFVIMLIVAGPKRMIRWAYLMGQYVAKMRRMWEDVVDMMQDEADAAGLDITIPKELPSKQSLTKLVVDAVKPYSDELKQPLDELQAPLRDTVAEANALMKEKPEKLGKKRRKMI